MLDKQLHYSLKPMKHGKFFRHSFVIVLHLFPLTKKFDYLNSKVARQQCLIRVIVGLNIEKKAQKEIVISE